MDKLTEIEIGKLYKFSEIFEKDNVTTQNLGYVKPVGGIYCIQNLYDLRKYIGGAKNIKSRWKNHIKDLRKGYHRSSALQEDYDDLGEEFFTLQLLKTCSTDKMREEENYYIELYGTRNRKFGYNSVNSTYFYKGEKNIKLLKSDGFNKVGGIFEINLQVKDEIFYTDDDGRFLYEPLSGEGKTFEIVAPI